MAIIYGPTYVQVEFHGGSLNSHWWQAITASPFLPQYFDYNSPEVVNRYHEFFTLVGCGGNQSAIFECLQTAPSESLMSANEKIGASALMGIFEWKPVVDGAFIQKRPSQALKGRTNGRRILTGVSQAALVNCVSEKS